MAVVAHVILRGVSPDQYDAVRAATGWVETRPRAPTRTSHGGRAKTNHNVDAWESEAAFAAFGQDRLGPAMAKLGINVAPEVTFHPAHEVFTPQSVTLT